MNEKYSSLFTPWKIGNCEIKNRIVQVSMGGTSLFGWLEPCHFDKEAAYHILNRAQNNVGLVLPGMQCVRDTMGIPGRHWLYQNKRMFRELAEWMPEFHKTGAKLPPMPEGSEPPQPDPPAQKPQAEREEKPTLPVLDLSGDHGLTDEQLLVLRTLSTTEPMLTDDLALRTDLPMRRVLSALTILEIDGLTCEAGARCFLRAVELKE